MMATTVEQQRILLLADQPQLTELQVMLEALHYQDVSVGLLSMPKLPVQDVDVVVIAAASYQSARLPMVQATYDNPPVLMILDTLPSTDEESNAMYPAQAISRSLLIPTVLRQSLEQTIQKHEQQVIKAAVTQIAAIGTEYDKPQEALDRLLDVLRELVPYTSIDIRLVDNDSLRLYHWRNYDPLSLSVIEDDQLVARSPLLERIRWGGEEIYLPDVQTNPDWVVYKELEWIRCWMGFPIRQQGEVIGTLNISHEKINGFRPHHVHRIKALLSHIAFLVVTAQLRETHERTVHILDAIRQQNDFVFTPLSRHNTLEELCQSIAETVVSAFGKTDCGVMLLDDAHEELVRVARAGEYHVSTTAPLYMSGKGLAVEAAKTGHVVYAPDVRQVENYVPNAPQTQSELVVPLKTRAGVIGVLDLQNTQIDAFTYREWDGLIGFAEHAATAIQNLRWFEAMRSQNQLLERRVQERTDAVDSARKRVEAILNRTSDAIALLNTEGRISQTNRAFELLFGIQPDEYFQKEIVKLAQAHHEQVIQDALETAYEKDNPTSVVEVELSRRDGTPFMAEISFSVVELHDRSVQKPDIVSSIRDITKHKEVQANLREALDATQELSELKSRFILTVTHEFRTPLTVIASSAGLLYDYGSQLEEDRRQQHLEQILAQVQHMEAMLEDTLIVGRGEDKTLTFEPEDVDFKQLVENTAATVNLTNGKPQIVIAHKGDDPTIFADRTLVQQVVSNLFTNAVKYAPNTDEVYCELIFNPSDCVLIVQDNGVGIPAEEQRLLFRPFFRAKNATAFKGTGLGLSIVKTAVERHGGRIEVESQEQTGTTFTVSIPRRAAL